MSGRLNETKEKLNKAVALKYQPQNDQAPKVIAKGRGKVAAPPYVFLECLFGVVWGCFLVAFGCGLVLNVYWFARGVVSGLFWGCFWCLGVFLGLAGVGG